MQQMFVEFINQIAAMFIVLLPLILAIVIMRSVMLDSSPAPTQQHSQMPVKAYLAMLMRTAHINGYPSIRKLDDILGVIKSGPEGIYYPVDCNHQGAILDMVPDIYEPHQVIGYCQETRMFFTYSSLHPPKISGRRRPDLK